MNKTEFIEAVAKKGEFSKKDAEKAVKKAANPDMTAEQILNAAFAYL